MSHETCRRYIDEARALGVKEYYFTGGEPFVRRDIFELIEKTLDDDEAELAILTNGTLFKGKRLEQLRAFDRERLRLQVSLDGSRPEINDPIRGAGSFTNIVAGIKTVIEEGFQVTVTTAITATNADDVPEVTRLVGSLGGTRHHLLWLHKRGRADGEGPDHTPAIKLVIVPSNLSKSFGRSQT
ncbi:MAG: radical SAM protein [Chloroflexi bacterium]|nr:radical SAM protein [Chloroflexota bacterium]